MSKQPNGKPPLIEAFRDPSTGRWLPGCPGRPRGSRVKFSESFARDFYADWQEHGFEVLDRVRRERPADYLKVAAIFLKPYLRELADLDASPLDGLQSVEDVQNYVIRTLPSLLPPGYELKPKHRGKPKT